MTDSDDAEGQLYRLLYFSSARFETAAQIEEAFPVILETARQKNSLNGITGCLLACNGWFVQILEGERKTVLTTFENIRCDPRHEGITLVKAAKADIRRFPLWSMCGQELSPADDAIVATLEKGDIFDASKLQPKQAMALLQRIQYLQEWQHGRPG